MPTTDLHDGSSSSTFGFSILSRRRDQVHHAVDPTHESNPQEMELENFQKNVAARFHDLASASPDDFLSIPWLQKLLDAFLSSQEEFNLIISHNRAQLSKPPMDRHVSEFFERSVKTLDVCNAIRDGIEQIRQWQKQLEIVLCALDNNNNNNSHKSLGEGQFRRAKKSLVDLALCMLDEKESNTAALAHRNRSFGRNNAQKEQKGLAQFRSLSWSVSRSWSAARQLQAISSNLAAPRAHEIVSTNGLSLAVFTMSYVLLIVTWALVAAIPCQDRGLQTHFYVGRQFLWAGPILSIHERILEESKKRERRNSCGLLREIHEIEKCARLLNGLVDSVKVFPLGEEREREVRERVSEVWAVYGALRDGLDPMEKRVRDVFHRIVRGRMEGLDSAGRANNSNGLKLTRAADDFTSDFQLSKDRAGPVFLSSETDAMFILTAHLKGYKREHIKIDINEDGTLIAISGEKHVKETVMIGWKVYNEDTTTKEFKKAFKIPGGVILDEIKANYNEDESTLKITMPKKVKGIMGMKIDEVDEKHELAREGSLNLKIADEKENSRNAGASDQENKLPLEARVVESIVKREEQIEKAAIIQETSEPKEDVHENHKKARDDEDGSVEEERLDEETERSSVEPREKRCKLCVPIVAGSTLLLSLVVFVFQMIRSKNQNIRRRE
ncbi:hypothetical protein STAS_10232 [Striga asiatica]|uniref:SHSP domain-containing protein n=1 Tax=Striga asiatica TaxID=4170 RepID=A0A5A7PN47_STRAF|nr:hypothetical protein STAS_10232 [Striga asiatica]